MAATETKAQRVERLKGQRKPGEAYAESVRFAREGWEAIPAEWLGTYFRWWGLYTQGDGVGAIGGKGGEGKATRHFMVRIRIPNGQLQAHQLRTIAGLAERYARGIADITVRQNIQLHWVTLESLPDVFQTLWRTGITTLGTRSEEHTSELQSRLHLVCRLLLEKKKNKRPSLFCIKLFFDYYTCPNVPITPKIVHTKSRSSVAYELITIRITRALTTESNHMSTN